MDFQLPQLGEGVYEAEMVAWLVSPGDTVRPGQGLMEVMTDKATMEVPAPFGGRITELCVQPGTTIKVGDHVLSYKDAGRVPEELPLPAPPAKTLPMEPDPIGPESGRGKNGRAKDLVSSPPVKASPSVRQLARKLGIDLSNVHGSGPGGRILLDDLQVTTAGQVAAGLATTPPRQAFAARLDTGRSGSRIKLAGVRKSIAKHLVHSKRTAPHFTYVDECDITDLVRLRASLREPFEKHGIKLTYLPFFVKATVAALKEVPIANSSLNDESGEIILHDRYNIGIATATPSGLLVPVIHDADKKDIATIAREMERITAEARAGKSRHEDLRGGTFTLTSIGGIGGLFATPIINHPEVGILGIGKAVKRPVFDAAGNIRAAEMIYLSLSFDHRVVDGAVGAVFGNVLIQQLQNPARLLLPEKLLVG